MAVVVVVVLVLVLVLVDWLVAWFILVPNGHGTVGSFPRSFAVSGGGQFPAADDGSDAGDQCGGHVQDPWSELTSEQVVQLWAFLVGVSFSQHFVTTNLG